MYTPGAFPAALNAVMLAPPYISFVFHYLTVGFYVCPLLDHAHYLVMPVT
jgi:hypothetical protein